MAYHHEGGHGSRRERPRTHSGDDGTTALANGQRLAKHDLRIEAIGDIEELNAALGMVLTERVPADVVRCLREIQQTLCEIGAELTLATGHRLSDSAIRRLDKQLAIYNATLPPLREFVIPRGSRATASCHLARSICRRCERRLVALMDRDDDDFNARLPAYLNRLSDLIFTIARGIARQSGERSEVPWRPLPDRR